MPIAVKRIQTELKRLSAMKFDDAPLIAAYTPDNDLKQLMFLVVGPPETPYHGGFFFVSMKFDEQYPFKAPFCTWMSNDDGKVRMNPNLYAGGKVCLSILGTWSGNSSEKWSEAAGMVTVIQAIQFAVLVESPYYNEPGFEKEQYLHLKDSGAAVGGAVKRCKTSTWEEHVAMVKTYTDKIAHESLRIGVCAVLENLLGISDTKNSLFPHMDHFRDLICREFLCRYEQYVEIAKDLQTRLEGTRFKMMPFETPESTNTVATGYSYFGNASGNFNATSLLRRLETIRKAHLALVDSWVPRSATGDAQVERKAADEIAFILRSSELKELGLVSCEPVDKSSLSVRVEFAVTEEKSLYRNVKQVAKITLHSNMSQTPVVEMVEGSVPAYHPNIPEAVPAFPYFFTGLSAVTDEEKRYGLATAVKGLLDLFANPLPSPVVGFNKSAVREYFSDDKEVIAAFKERVGASKTATAATVVAVAPIPPAPVEPKESKSPMSQKPPAKKAEIVYEIIDDSD